MNQNIHRPKKKRMRNCPGNHERVRITPGARRYKTTTSGKEKNEMSYTVQHNSKTLNSDITPEKGSKPSQAHTKIGQWTGKKPGSSNQQVGQGLSQPLDTQCLSTLIPPISKDPWMMTSTDVTFNQWKRDAIQIWWCQAQMECQAVNPFENRVSRLPSERLRQSSKDRKPIWL